MILTKIPLGTVLLEKIHTQDGSYARPDNGWDTLPEWTYGDACIIKITAAGHYQWGPFKYRSNEQREYSGIEEVIIERSEIFGQEGYQNRADDFLLEKGSLLEQQGFKVEIKEYTNKDPQNLNDKIEWTSGKPPEWVLKRMDSWNWKEYQQPTLKELIAYKGKER